MIHYLAGPMSGRLDHNYPAFNEAATRLRAAGLTVTSPHELHAGDTSRPWAWYLRRDLRALLDCDTLVLLPGWRDSRGATLERTVATNLGMRVVELADLYAEIRARDNRIRRVRKLAAPRVHIGGSETR